MNFDISYNEKGEAYFIISTGANSPPLRASVGAIKSMIDAENTVSQEDRARLIAILIQYGLLTERGNLCPELPPPLWERYSWGASYRFHKAAQRTSFSDVGVDFQHIQRERASEYRASAPLPGPQQCSDAAVKLEAAPKKMTAEREAGKVLVARKCSEKPKNRTARFRDLSRVLWEGCVSFRNQWRPNDNVNVFDSFGTCFDFWLVVFNVEGLDAGIYRYLVDKHVLDPMAIKPSRSELCDILIGHSAPLSCAFSLILVADYERAMWRYRHERALRNIYVESGRICQKLLIEFTAGGFSTHITPASQDSKMEKLLGLSFDRQSAVYTISCG